MLNSKTIYFYAFASALVASSSPAQAVRYAVSDPVTLQEVVAKALPGDVISLQSGNYDLARIDGGKLRITRSGRVNNPITLEGPKTAVLKAKKYAVHLEGASYWRIAGFTVNGARKGIVLDGASHVLLDDLTVRNTDEEAVHFRMGSHNNVLTRSTITDTGKRKPKYGEAVYVGSAESNWSEIMGSSKKPDNVRNTCISKNTLGPRVTAEAIDIKEGSSYTYVFDNTIDMHGISGQNFADSAVDMKGTFIYATDNRIGNSEVTVLSNPKRLPDAFQSHRIDNPAKVPSGTNIWVWGNTADLKSASVKGANPGMMYRSDGKGSNRYCTNTITKGDLTSDLPVSCETVSPTMPATCPAVLNTQ